MEETKNPLEEELRESVDPADKVDADEKDAKKDKKAKKENEKTLTAEIDALKAEIKEQDDKYLRMAAEYDNFRRRSREEKDATYENAMADTVAELLPIIDNLERAAAFEGDGKLKEGITMIAKSVEAVFSKLGIEAVGKPHDKFDPNLHNAVMHEENEEFGEGEIVEVYQKGYKKGNKIIRFAMVKTAN